MTKFVKGMFQINGDFITYCDGTNTKKVVARFKYAKSSQASFISFLIKNFTVEEYFTRLKTEYSPLAILQSKGYMLAHVKKLLKDAGYSTDKAGLDAYVANRV
jgi:hypothetical protein